MAYLSSRLASGQCCLKSVAILIQVGSKNPRIVAAGSAMPAPVKDSPWSSFERGQIVEIDCRDDRRHVQGKALLLIEDFVYLKGVQYAEASHLGASDSYYAWWADKDQPTSGAAAVKGH